MASQVALVVKNPPANAGDARDTVWSLGWEDHLEEETRQPVVVFSCQENSMDRGVWWATVHEAAESDMTEHDKNMYLSRYCISPLLFIN